MKCQNCGAENENNSRVCSLCGSKISDDMKQEQQKKLGCPNCGSTNTIFKREKQGEIRNKKGATIVRNTVGFCKACGHTWQTTNNSKEGKKTWLWVLGWICIFPLPLTIILLRKKDMKPSVKYSIIGIAWIIYLLIGYSGTQKNKQETDIKNDTVIEKVVNEESVTKDTITTDEDTSESTNTHEDYRINESEFIALASLTLDKYISDYKMSLAPQLWTIVAIDDTDTYFGYTKITYKGKEGLFRYCGTVEKDEKGKIIGGTGHFIKVLEDVLYDDNYENGYYTSFFENVTENSLPR